jgi:hypothetical protein
MSKYHISVNQFAEFSKATEKGKKRIISNQIKVDRLLVSWYRTAKAYMRKYFTDFNNTAPLKEGIEKLNEKKAETKHQIIDKRVSIEAIEKLMHIAFPKVLYSNSHEIIKPEKKPISVNDVDISITPEAIFKTIVNGIVVYGGIKLHFGKSHPFDNTQCRYVAILLHNYIKENIAKPGEIVDFKLCLCIDLFSQRVVTPEGLSPIEITQIKKVCNEIKEVWAKAA